MSGIRQPMELRALELSERRWEDHLTTLRRALVLLARLQNGEEPDELQRTVIRGVRRDLRELVEVIAGVLE